MDSSAADPGLLATLGWIDLTALAVVLVFFVLGLFRGFVWQFSRIVTLVVAYVAAGMYGDAIAERMSSWFSEDVQSTQLPLYIAYFLVFVVVLVVVSIIAHFVDKLVTHTGLSFYNRVGGGVLGVITGGCVVLAVLAGILMFAGDTGVAQAAHSSRSMTVGKRALGFLGDVVPEPVRELFGVEGEAGEDEDGEGTSGQGEGEGK